MKKNILVIYAAAALILLLYISGCSSTEPQQQTTPPPPTVANPTPTVDPSQIMLEKLTLDEKIGQLMIVGFQENTGEQQIADYINTYKVSGFILFKRNYKDFEEFYKLCAKLKELNANNPLPLFLSVDEEGGTVSRLPAGGTKFPDAILIGKVNKPDLTYKVGETIGKELTSAGINLNFAPVLDILIDPKSTLLAKRAYGSNADIVSEQGTAFIKGLKDQNIIAAAKHFPGHGGTNIDSHAQLPVINIDKNMLDNRELIPFKKAFSEGLDAIMVGHLAFPLIDPTGLPASKSKVFLTDILRNELNFKGVVFTDEIEMLGFSENSDLSESIITAFNAGADVFVIGHTKSIQDKVYSTLKAAVTEGKISETRLNEALLRIIALKQKYKLADKSNISFEEASKVFGSEENKAVLQLVKDEIKKTNQ